MRKTFDRLYAISCALLSFLALFILAFLVYFIVKESLPALQEIGIRNLLGDSWRPIIYKDSPSYGFANMLLSTLYVSALAVLFSLVIGVGAALFLATRLSDRWRSILMPYIELLASVPSVVYGFVGLLVVVKSFERLGMASGESILAGAIVLAVMILPYMIASCCDTMLTLNKHYAMVSASLGISRWYTSGILILSASRRGILISTALATGRAMGETMAVMMLLGNAMTVPRLLGKGETISALIALEMGMAEVGSLHYSALYASGLLLLLLLLLINIVFSLFKKKLKGEGLL